MTEQKDGGAADAETLLGIDLRARAERLVAAAEAFAASANWLRKAAIIGGSIAATAVLAVLVFAIAVFADLSAGHDARDQIVDCVQPTGTCYQQGQARTAQILTSVNEQGVIRAACAQEEIKVEPISRRIDAIQACIAQQTQK